ncbi:MAG: hypothetical protein ACLR6B_08625 [Blautia sp.]
MRALFQKNLPEQQGRKDADGLLKKLREGWKTCFFPSNKTACDDGMERGEGQRERQIFQKLFTADILQESFCQNSCTAPERSCCKTGKKEREYGPCEKNFPDPFFISEGIFLET